MPRSATPQGHATKSDKRDKRDGRDESAASEQWLRIAPRRPMKGLRAARRALLGVLRARGVILEGQRQRELDETWMQLALDEAQAAAAAGDVPVGAIIVDERGEVVGRGRNRRELARDPTAHAELEALREAARHRGAWRLTGLTLYVTLEPCPMCAGALVNARISRVVYGCADPKAGAVDTLFTIGRDTRLNHRYEVQAQILADECASVLRAFFAPRRTPREKEPTPGTRSGSDTKD